MDLFLALLIAPLGYYFHFGTDKGLIISIILYICSFTIAGCIFLNMRFGLDLCTSILCYILPPAAVYMKTGDVCKSLICIGLFCCFLVPGIFYGYTICHEKNYIESLKNDSNEHFVRHS